MCVRPVHARGAAAIPCRRRCSCHTPAALLLLKRQGHIERAAITRDAHSKRGFTVVVAVGHVESLVPAQRALGLSPRQLSDAAVLRDISVRELVDLTVNRHEVDERKDGSKHQDGSGNLRRSWAERPPQDFNQHVQPPTAEPPPPIVNCPPLSKHSSVPIRVSTTKPSCKFIAVKSY